MGTRACLTLYEITLGNWGPPTWLLVEHVSEWFMPVLIAFKLSAGFAMLNVIMAVFLRQTTKCAEAIDDFALKQRRKATEAFTVRLVEMFLELDVSGDGVLNQEEFKAIMENEALIAWLDQAHISTKDAEQLFRALDTG